MRSDFYIQRQTNKCLFNKNFPLIFIRQKEHAIIKNESGLILSRTKGVPHNSNHQHRSVASHMHPDRGPNLQPRRVP